MARSARLENYLVLAAVPGIASAAVADIIHTEVNQTYGHADIGNVARGEDGLSFQVGSGSVMATISFGIDDYLQPSFSGGTMRNLSAFIVGGALVNRSSGYFGYAYNGLRGQAGDFFGPGGVGQTTQREPWHTSNYRVDCTYGIIAGSNQWSFYDSFKSSMQYNSSQDGEWNANFGDDPARGFLGFAFGDPNDRNWGWIDFTWSYDTLTVHGYAWETEAGVGIIAGATGGPVVPGAPTAVGLLGLAAGAAGVRRKRSA